MTDLPAYLTNRVVNAFRVSIQLFLRPTRFGFSLLEKKKSFVHVKNSAVRLSWFEKLLPAALRNVPAHYTISKKLTVWKNTTTAGKMWDVLMILLSVMACVLYVQQSYYNTFSASIIYGNFENVITQLFLTDFILSYIIANNKVYFLTSLWTVVDILTILPVYVSYMMDGHSRVNLSVFRFVRILRLVRILRTFKMLNSLSGVRRGILTLALSIVSLTFISAGLLQILESDVKDQLYYKCRFINSQTHWRPSCYLSRPSYPEIDLSCDCDQNHCISFYQKGDRRGEPSSITCQSFTFFDAVYFIVYTVSLVGYGSQGIITSPSSQLLVIIFIVVSMIVIPMQINDLSLLMNATSPFRKPFSPRADDRMAHIILCGAVCDPKRMRKILRELIHPDRMGNQAMEFRIVILSPSEPSEGMKALLLSDHFDQTTQYIVGSALSAVDLQRARGDLAAAIIFFCNTDVFISDAQSFVDDTATILKTFSVNNYNDRLECLVQTVRKEERDLLKDNQADVILCLDDYKTALQARNSICPGMSTLVENLLHSFSGNKDSVIGQASAPTASRAFKESWRVEYDTGASNELYFFQLPFEYMQTLSFEWTLMAEGIFLEFDMMVIGVCDAINRSVVLNPSSLEINSLKTPGRFYEVYNIAILLAPNQDAATFIGLSLKENGIIARIVNKLIRAEEQLKVRTRRVVKDKKISVENQRGLFFKELVRFSKTRTQRYLSTASSKAEQFEANNVDGDNQEDFCGFVGSSTSSGKTNLRNINRKVGSVRNSEKLNVPGPPASSEVGQSSGRSLSLLKSFVSNKVAPAPSSDGDEASKGGDEEDIVSEGDRVRFALDSAVSSRNSFAPSFTKDKFQRRSGIRDSTLSAPAPAPAGDRAPGLPLGMRGISSMSQQMSMVRALVQDEEEFQEDLRLAVDDSIDYGRESNKLKHANRLKRHVIVFGCMKNLCTFVAELRRPLILNEAYHSILIVNEVEPESWYEIADIYDDVFFLQGKITSSFDFNRINIPEAYSVVMLADRESVTRIEEDSLDAEALFAFIKLEKYIPDHIFFTVELTIASNIVVINSTILRQAKGNERYGLIRLKSDSQSFSGRRGSLSDVESPYSSQKLKPVQIKGTFYTNRVSIDNLGGMKNVEDSSLTPPSSSKIKVKPPAATELRSGSKSKPKRVMISLHHRRMQKEAEDMHSRAMEAQRWGRRVSSFRHTTIQTSTKKVRNAAKDVDMFWKIDETHHALPVFASGRAFVADSFDTLLCQSFFAPYTPIVAEKLVCGQKYQTLYHLPVPRYFVGRYFIDLYRACLARNLMVLALYRGPSKCDNCPLPYVYTSPAPDCIVRIRDCMFVYCSPVDLAATKKSCLSVPLATLVDGNICLADLLGEEPSVAVKSTNNKRVTIHDVGKKVLSTISLKLRLSKMAPAKRSEDKDNVHDSSNHSKDQ